MPIITCPKCKKRYDPGVDDELETLADAPANLSLKVVCPACGQWLRLPEKERIPTPAAPPEMLREMRKQSRLFDDDSDSDDDEPPPRRRRRDEVEDEPPRRRRRDEVDEDEPPRRRRRDEEDEDEPPRRRRRDEEDDEEDEDDRPPPKRIKPKKPKVRQVPAPMAPMVLAILPVLCPFFVIGIGIGVAALNRANAALDELPRGKAGRDARKMLNFAKILAYIGISLSTVATLIGLVLKFSGQ